MSTSNRGSLILVLAVLVAMVGFQSGFAEEREWVGAPIEETRQAAEEGDPSAQYELGFKYDWGWGVAKDHQEAVKWYRLAAEQGNVGAQLELGDKYRFGRDVPQDYDEAVRWYRKAAWQGSKRAQVDLGTMYFFGKDVPRDPREAVMWLRRAAEQEAYLYPPIIAFSDAFIEDMLAGLYESGEGVQDYREAVKWYRKAAARGYAPAQRSLGDMYYRGKGVPQHYREALKWFRMAAEQGDALAQILLGEMYAIGRGVSQDYVQAYAWLSLAAIEGGTADSVSSRLRDRLVAEMPPEDLAAAQDLSAELHQRIESTKSK